MKKNKKRLLYWLLAAGVLILSFLIIALNSQEDSETGTDTSILTDSEWEKGNLESEIVLVEYSDFQCPACSARQPMINDIVGEFDSHIKFVFKQFPLRSIHPNAQLAAQASESAGLQGKFWEMHDKLFETQSEWSVLQGILVAETFTEYALELGLDTEQFEKDMNSRDVKDAVNSDFDNGRDANVGGTPTFFLNGEPFNLRNYEQAREEIREVIDEASA